MTTKGSLLECSEILKVFFSSSGSYHWMLSRIVDWSFARTTFLFKVPCSAAYFGNVDFGLSFFVVQGIDDFLPALFQVHWCKKNRSDIKIQNDGWRSLLTFLRASLLCNRRCRIEYRFQRKFCLVVIQRLDVKISRFKNRPQTSQCEMLGVVSKTSLMDALLQTKLISFSSSSCTINSWIPDLHEIAIDVEL